jgi:hypothetical protein
MKMKGNIRGRATIISRNKNQDGLIEMDKVVRALIHADRWTNHEINTRSAAFYNAPKKNLFLQ